MSKAQASKERIGILGGTFNPIHYGHIKIAETARQRLHFEKTLIIPASIPPHKPSYKNVSPEDRYNMCLLAAKDYSNIEVSDVELKREGKSYTIDTLQELAEIYPGYRFCLVMGADMFLSFLNWKSPEKILELSDICAMPRGEFDVKALSDYCAENGISSESVTTLDMPAINISSTLIREIIADGGIPTGLTSPEVIDYITEKGLYRTDR